ncbi:hypothetical protein GMST_07390 [Geomonas silvestris]|uniref:Uncharacterized protein n=1 Tax=Geomonas silvestris TaxID=2740184 RepID=A0A6V8MEY7_9BACT|nr:hypothetical protein [Geomonas silvestris]GFO58414.1 hypothetical protein GMST_07390 [Geomonas silvestris]
MLVISERQMEAMGKAMMDRFVAITLDFIRINFPEWSGSQSNDALTAFVRSMIKFAQEHEIRQEISIQKLIEYKILFQFDTPLSPQLVSILTKVDLAEDSRLEYFKRQIEDLSPLIKLTLEGVMENWP